jgi:hypothetical protein
MALNLETRIVTRRSDAAQRVDADIVVLGAGIAGVSAALEAARLGRRVALIDGAPTLGGQAVGAIIGTFCGFYSNGPNPYQVTHGIADDILRDLGKAGALNHIHGRRNTTIVQYNETTLARWIEEAVRKAQIQVLLGAILLDVRRDGGRIVGLNLATRYGEVMIEGQGFVDASGDAALTFAAGFACREPANAIFGTQMIVLEGIDEAALTLLDRSELQRRLTAKGDAYGLKRHDGFLFAPPGQGIALVNMTHIETPLDAVAASRQQLEARAEADRLLALLRAEYPAALGSARIRSYGLPGIRQTRWIVGQHHLVADEVRQGVHFADAIGRCSWPIELHQRPDDVHWEVFGDDHMHWIPLGMLLPVEADNLVAAGRCADGDPAALASVRVMGPCIAMGAAAAHALDLAGAGSVKQIDIAALQARLRDNLERTD